MPVIIIMYQILGRKRIKLFYEPQLLSVDSVVDDQALYASSLLYYNEIYVHIWNR